MIVCVFSYRTFSEAVFDIYNCHNISITYSTFHDNRGTGISRYRFRGNTGAVAIGFNGVPTHYIQPQVIIFNCNFTRNSATAEAMFRSSSGAFFNRAFSGRGGGVGMFFNEDYHNVSVQIVDNKFQSNYARSFGGAVFLVVFNEGTHHVLDLERNTFDSNIAVLGGGAIQMTFISNGIREDPHVTSFVDCLFQNNSGASGGAIYVYAATLQGTQKLKALVILVLMYTSYHCDNKTVQMEMVHKLFLSVLNFWGTGDSQGKGQSLEQLSVSHSQISFVTESPFPIIGLLIGECVWR